MQICYSESDLRELRSQLCQAKARLQVMREAWREVDWHHFLYDHPEAKGWFDEDGVPT